MAWFDHAYGVIDRTTADAIEHSELLREVCLVTVRTVSTGERSWHGRYLLLPSTCLEFFGPGDEPELSDGATGVALSTRGAGGVRAIAESVGALEPPADVGSQHRQQEDGTRVPWFDFCEVSLPERPTLSAWAMEYVAEDDRATRASRYAEWMAERPLRLLDVATVEIDAPAEEIRRAGRLLEVAGFDVDASGGTVLARDAAVTLELRASDSPGLRRLVFGLSAPPGEERAEALGGSLLVLGPDATAVWEFPAG